MMKRTNRILIMMIVLVAVGLMTMLPSAAVSYSTGTANASFEGYDSIDAANNIHNLTIGFNTTNDTASLLWQVNITNPGSYDWQWVTIDVWNGTDWFTASATNNTTFYANSANTANTTTPSRTHGFAADANNLKNYSAVIALRTTNATVDLGGFTVNVSNAGNTSEWAGLTGLNFTAQLYVNMTGWWYEGCNFNTNSTMPIQAAVDGATAGETIYVYNGSYNETVNVNKRLTLQGEGKDVVNVTNSTANQHVFHVTADYVNITGFNVSGATANGKAGICINNMQHCNISDNIAAGNYYGIYLESSSNNTLTSNTASSNSQRGIILLSSSNNTLTNNTASPNNTRGIYLYSSSNNTLTSNDASNNDYGIFLICSSNNNTLTSNDASNNDYGIFLTYSSNNMLTSNNASNNSNRGIYLCSSSNNNTIYNNYFDNGNNAYDAGNNTWNTTPATGTNIFGGLWLGGNYWSDYAGADTIGDGLGDTLTPYNSSNGISNGGDYHPLVQGTTPPAPATLTNTSGNTWVNYTWAAGSGGGATDLYNVSMNVTTWHNGTADTSLNTTVSSGGWVNITVWAYNMSGCGNLSATCASDNVRARIPGDVNCDGVVDSSDATLLFDWVSFPNERGTTYAHIELNNADVTGNAVVNVGDAILLFNWVSFGDPYVLH